MNSKIYNDVQALLAGYVSISPTEFNMNANLDRVYDMDSTELTELAMKIEQQFGVSVSRSERQDWETGADICRFLEGKTTGSPVTANLQKA